jgi:hypothetical protein
LRPLPWLKFSYLSAVVLGAFFLYFSWIFPLHRFIPLSGHRSLETTPGIYLIALFTVVSPVWAFAHFVRLHSSLHRVARDQSRCVLTGSALTAILGLACNLFLPLAHKYSWVWLGPVSSCDPRNKSIIS